MMALRILRAGIQLNGAGDNHSQDDHPKGKRPIDRVRDGAGSLTVGTNEDGVLTGMIALENVAYLVKERAIYRLMMADDIDPERENINIPNSVQLTLSDGSDSDLVARTLLTADQLFKKTYFPAEVRDRIVLIALDIATNLLAAQQIAEEVGARIELLSKPIEVKNRSATLPSAGSLESRTNAFVQAAHSVIQRLYDLPRPFVKFPPKGWPDNFTDALRDQFGDDHEFTQFARSITPFIKFIRNMRHCIEHRRGDQRIEIKDFHLTKDGKFNRPTVAIIHGETPLDATDLVEFMNNTVYQLIDIVETMIAQVADIERPQTIARFPLTIALIPEDQRREGSRVRLGYFSLLKGQWVRMG
jgi:hypothetical protein